MSLPELGSVHRGVVVSIQSFGAFVQLGDGAICKDGLLHISSISEERVDRIEDVLDVGAVVWCKVSSIKEDEDKYSLDMRRVSQKDGTDLSSSRAGSRALATELPLHSEPVPSKRSQGIVGARRAGGSASSGSSGDSDADIAKAKKQARKALKKMKKAQKNERKLAKKVKSKAKRKEMRALGKSKKASSSSSSSASSSISSAALDVPDDILQALMAQKRRPQQEGAHDGFEEGNGKSGATQEREAAREPTAGGSSAARLPEGWVKKTSTSLGKEYYVNEHLGKTQWTAPTAAQAAAAELLAERGRRLDERRSREVEERKKEEDDRIKAAIKDEESRAGGRRGGGAVPFWAQKRAGSPERAANAGGALKRSR